MQLSSRLIRHESDKFSLFAQILTDNERHIPIGVERDFSGMLRLRVAEQDISSITELAAFLPTRVINSHSHNIFESGPIYRRKYLDWGLFYQFDNFFSVWRLFERALKQRNAALRNSRPKRELDVWTEELVKHGVALDSLRREYVQLLTPMIVEIAEILLNISNFDVKYLSGWDENSDYFAVLADSFQDELRSGYTQNGPHRADLDVCIDNVPVKHILSRGQQKLLICAMILAQGMLLEQHANKGLIYLIDDLPSELDLQSKQKLISLLAKQKTQVFITSIESESICDLVSDKLEVPIESVSRGTWSD